MHWQKGIRLDPMQSDVLTFATALTDATDQLTRVSVTKDKEEVSLTTHVILALSGDLKKSRNS